MAGFNYFQGFQKGALKKVKRSGKSFQKSVDILIVVLYISHKEMAFRNTKQNIAREGLRDLNH